MKTRKKNQMIEALRNSLGIVKNACEIVGINRDTHYEWMKSDPDYKQQVEEILEGTLDFAESALLTQMGNGNVNAIIFYLKTKGKTRGYAEKELTFNKNDTIFIGGNIHELIQKAEDLWKSKEV